ncbi:MAG: GDP-mannose 4,6-dehydratase [candidate division WOR-3 bacterium]|nr:GDP-mannose 4,6-dehydratase [candidate division WOR-3 bacterium]
MLVAAKKVFITGIEGFVGSYLTSDLINKGYQVSGINLVELPADFPKVQVHQCDIKDKERLKEILSEERPTAVFHLAAVSSVDTCEHCPELAFEINTQGTFNLFEALRELEMHPKIIFISSCEVYETKNGTRKSKAKLSEKSPIRASSVYALTKICAEEVADFFSNRHGLRITILRPFTHTGPGQSEKFVFPSVTKQIVEIEQGKRPPVIELGNIDVFRDYTDVRDMVKAYELAFLYCAPGEIYNITSERTYSIREGVETLIKLAQKPIDIKIVSEKVRQWGNQYLAGDCRKFRKATNWKPEIDFKTTLSDLLEYSRKTIRD